jgi:hypothetical protein
VTPRSRVDRRLGGDLRDADASSLEQLNAAIERAFRAVRDLNMEEVLPEILSINLKAIALPQAARRQSETRGRFGLHGLRRSRHHAIARVIGQNLSHCHSQPPPR